MTRAERKAALAVGLAWLLLEEAVETAPRGSAARSALVAEEALLAKAIDRMSERLGVDTSDLVQEAGCVRHRDLSAAAEEWEQSERRAVEQAGRARMEQDGLLEPIA